MFRTDPEHCVQQRKNSPTQCICHQGALCQQLLRIWTPQWVEGAGVFMDNILDYIAMRYIETSGWSSIMKRALSYGGNCSFWGTLLTNQASSQTLTRWRLYGSGHHLQMCRILGMMNYLGRHSPNSITVGQPLHEHLKKCIDMGRCTASSLWTY